MCMKLVIFMQLHFLGIDRVEIIVSFEEAKYVYLHFDLSKLIQLLQDFRHAFVSFDLDKCDF